jgi:hypothetical protein
LDVIGDVLYGWRIFAPVTPRGKGDDLTDGGTTHGNTNAELKAVTAELNRCDIRLAPALQRANSPLLRQEISGARMRCIAFPQVR